MKDFDAFNFTRQFLNGIEDAGFTEPTEVQKRVIPIIKSGQDVIGVAQTGTGKTAAFVLPIISDLKYAKGSNVRALMLAPTRELAIQIESNINTLAKYTDLRVIGLYGGVGKTKQIDDLRDGVDIIVATPGRFMELYLLGEINAKRIRFLVLDEADRMLDMGFVRQIRDILEILPVKRKNLLFSATFNEEIEILTREFMECPEIVEVGKTNTPVGSVEMFKYHLPNQKTKMNLLVHLLKDDEEFNRILVFTRTKKEADSVFDFVKNKVKAEIKVIHSNKSQQVRINAVKAFANGEVRLLIASDVASRGIDVEKISHVFNFDVPRLKDDFIHRVGRTGRASHKGTAITFMNDAEQLYFKLIEKELGISMELLELPEGVHVEPTQPAEKKEIARMVDDYKKMVDPTYKGAFHKKKRPSRNYMDRNSKKKRTVGSTKRSGGKKKR